MRIIRDFVGFLLLFYILFGGGPARAQLIARPCIDTADTIGHRPLPLYEPCIRLGTMDYQFKYGETIDFADFTESINYDKSVPGWNIPIHEGYVWIKVQGRYRLIPYYKSPLTIDDHGHEESDTR